MLTYEDCVGMCELTEEEVDAIADSPTERDCGNGGGGSWGGGR